MADPPPAGGTPVAWLDPGGSGYCSSMVSPLFSTMAAVPQGDTIVALASPNALSRAADVAVVVIGLAVVVLSVVLARVLLQVNRTLKEARAGLHQNLGPVSDRARAISDNVEFITQALRTDVERLNASVRALTDRLHQASDRMEERIGEFNALMEVVQGEAEDIFLDTAATVHGVREGAREGARRIGRESERPAPTDEATYLDLDAADGEDERQLAAGEVAEPEGGSSTG